MTLQRCKALDGDTQKASKQATVQQSEGLCEGCRRDLAAVRACA